MANTTDATLNIFIITQPNFPIPIYLLKYSSTRWGSVRCLLDVYDNGIVSLTARTQCRDQLSMVHQRSGKES
eukprot:scaffold15233_cov53-Cyclotella_meneghiniana.AAC.2